MIINVLINIFESQKVVNINMARKTIVYLQIYYTNRKKIKAMIN